METKKELEVPAIIIVEIDRDIFDELESDGWVKAVLFRQRVGKGVRYFIKKGES